ncbi:hypothetical protein D2C78_07295 [Helicobacter pylori]|nr:hypothetical protein [Helicobacter pylori]NHB30164.1 hypothetical protein [Helicobacter pylori]PDW63924.1 hypothetical protein BB445_00560 [Helicobacter pylori]PUD11496.1 hypothetical protein C2R86_03535 [Helicobacter pylori]QEF35664.1 hypothetical protein D2C78_07295 [Helicobacter pylori]
MGNKEYCHAKEFQKGLFRALCLGALCLLGEWCSNLGRL